MKISYYLPNNLITNDDLYKSTNNDPQWSDEKIVEKCGIRIRHIASEGELVSHMCIKASKKLLDEYNIEPSEIDFIILCTETPDYLQPASAFLVASELGLRQDIGAFDIKLACSGYTYALYIAKGLIATKIAKKVLVCTADLTATTNKNTSIAQRILFSDGASATLIDEDNVYKLHIPVFGSDGKEFFTMYRKFGGCAYPINNENFDEYISSPSPFAPELKGPEIFLFTLKEVPKLINNILKKNNTGLENIDFLVLHQANILILNRIIKALNLPKDKVIIDIEEVGNTASSSIPIAIKRAMQNGVLKTGNKILIAGFGIGLSWSGTLVTI